MILLRLISWPYTRRHLVRTLLTTAGIVLGVGVFVGMHTANQSVLYALHETVDRIAGATQLQVTAGESGFDESVLERVQERPEVRVAVPVIEAVVDTALPGQGSVMILAVDMTGDRSLRDYTLESGDESVVDDPLVFLAQPDSLIVTREFAEQNHLRTDSAVPMRTMDGPKRFVVRGIMKSSGLAKAFGGNLAIMDVYAAQKVFGRGRKFDRIDLAVTGGYSIEQCRAALEKTLGPGFEVETPASRGRQFDSVLRVYSVTVNITSLFALFIGMFIIYNSFAIAVTQRRAEIGILRALGATRRQIRALFLAESAVAGLVGSTLGLGFGYLLARGTAGYVGQMLQGISGIAQRVEDVATDPRLMGLAVVMGVATSMVAAFVPARNAARVDPVQALQKGRYQVLSAGENRARRLVALAFAGVSAGCLVDRQERRRLLRRLHPRHGGGAAPDAGARAVAHARSPTAARLAVAGRGRAGGRQPDPGAPADVGHGVGADALAEHDDRPRRGVEGQLRIDRRLDGHGAQPGPVRHRLADADQPQLPLPGLPRADDRAGRRRGAGAGRPHAAHPVPRHARCCSSPSRCRSGRPGPGGGRSKAGPTRPTGWPPRAGGRSCRRTWRR